MLTALQCLKKSPLFQSAKEEELALLAKNLTKHTYLKNELIFHEGAKAERLYLVWQGQVKIYKLSTEGKECIFDIAAGCQLFGEVPMFAGITYPANAVALIDTVVFSLARNDLLELIKQNAQIALNLLALQANRLREFTLKVEHLSLQKTEQNLLDYLQNKGQTESLSMQNLANSLGVSREALSRIVSKLIKSGHVKKANNRLTLK